METLLLVESNTTGTGRLFAGRARAMGVEPVLVAADPSRYPYAEADRVRVVRADTADPARVLEAARSLPGGPPSGVTTSSEYYLPVAARTAAALGRPGPDPEALSRCRHKGYQRADLAAAGVPVPRFGRAGTASAAVAHAERFGYPVIVKPVDGSGSVGVRGCARAEQVAEHTSALLDRRCNERGLPVARQVLVEEYAVGPEYSVEMLGSTAVAVVAKHLGPVPHFVEVGHDAPAELTNDDDETLRAVARRAVAALGLGFGAAHVEIRLTASGPVLMEVNPRLAGGMIPELIRVGTGIDLISAQVCAALGATMPLVARWEGFASLRFLTAMAGTVLVDDVGPLADAACSPGVVDARLYRARGDRLDRARDFRDRVGHVMAAADTGHEARRAAVAALARLSRAIGPAAQRLEEAAA